MIESNVPIFEIQEEREEEDINTNRDLVFERLNTEYGEEDEELDYEIIAKEISQYNQTAIFVVLALILFQLSQSLKFSILFSVLPLVLQDLKNFCFSILALITSASSQDAAISRLTVLKQLIQSVGSLSFYSLLAGYYFYPKIHLTPVSSPLLLSFIIEFLIKTKSLNQCQLFSTLVRFTQCFTLSRSVRILQLILIGLKCDELIQIEWQAAFWPIWMATVAVGFLSGGALLLTIISIFSYCLNEASISDVYSSIWLSYATNMGLATLLLTSHDLLSARFDRVSIYGIVYLAVLVGLTQILKVHLLKWWRSCFVSDEQFSIPSSLSHSSPLPLPPSQAQHMRFATKLIRAIKLPPRALVRMSSTYFQPASPGKNPAKVARTVSHDLKDTISRENVHFRSLSSVPREKTQVIRKTGNDLSFTEKKCSICCESECNSVLMDCGHGGICLHCAKFLMKNVGKCHMCRRDIVQVLKIKVESSKVLKVVGTNTNLE